MTEDEWADFADLWGSRADTTASLLGPAMAFFLEHLGEHKTDIELLDRWLKAIRPKSGWREETTFDPRQPVLRMKSEYDRDWRFIHGEF